MSVGRIHEQRQFESALHAQSSTILAIEGDSGSGKTSLLQTYLAMCQERHLPAALISLTQVITAAAFAQEIADQLAMAGLRLPIYETLLSRRRRETDQLRVGRQSRSLEDPPFVDLRYGPPDGAAEFAAIVEDLIDSREHPVSVLLLDDYDRAYP